LDTIGKIIDQAYLDDNQITQFISASLLKNSTEFLEALVNQT
jgi:hypothetical protein